MKQSAQILKRKTSYDGYHRLDQLSLRHECFNGEWTPSLPREVIIRKDVVAVLLFDPTHDKIVLIEQFRVGAFVRCHDTDPTANHASSWLFEIVAGDVELGESIESVARRETQEETGLAIQQLVPITQYYVSPANHTGKLFLFCGLVNAEQTEGIHGLPAEGEDIKAHAVTVEDALSYLQQGNIQYAPAIIALQWFSLNADTIRKQMKP